MSIFDGRLLGLLLTVAKKQMFGNFENGFLVEFHAGLFYTIEDLTDIVIVLFLRQSIELNA